MWEFIAKAFGGSAGEVAKEVFGGIEGLIKQWHASPEQLAQWEQVKAELLDRAASRDALVTSQLAALSVQDKANARDREIAIRDHTPTILACGVLFVFVLANWYVFSHPLPEGNETLVARVLGTLDTTLALIVGYYYGSSSSSAAKQATIEKMVNK